MVEFITQTGAEVNINFAEAELAFELKRAIQKELIKYNVAWPKEINKENVLQTEVTPEILNSIKDLYLYIDGSQEVEKIIFKCLVRATYNKVRITKETFNDPKALADYYEIVYKCIEVNVFPFFKNLISFAPALLNLISNGQDLKLEQEKNSQQHSA